MKSRAYAESMAADQGPETLTKDFHGVTGLRVRAHARGDPVTRTTGASAR